MRNIQSTAVSAFALLPLTAMAWNFVPDLYQTDQCSGDGPQAACPVPACGATSSASGPFNYLSFRYHASEEVPRTAQIIIGCRDTGDNYIAGPTLGADLLNDGQCVTPCPEGYFIGLFRTTDPSCDCTTAEGNLSPVVTCGNLGCDPSQPSGCGGTGLCI